jgi:uncharacterized heparinase superfamily protein
LRHPVAPPRLRSGILALAAPLAARLSSAAFAPVVARAEQLRDGAFHAVGECLPVEEIDWVGRPRSHLFTYHLHYFDDAPGLALLARRGDRAAGARLRTLWNGWLDACERGAGDGWDPYPIASRIPNWIQALALLAHPDRASDAVDLGHPPGSVGGAPGEPLLSPDLRDRLLASLWTQADRLRRTLEYDLSGNHLLRDRTALVWTSGALQPVPWSLGADTTALLRELRRQVLSDGMHEERTPGYHALALSDVLQVIEMLRAVDAVVPSELEEQARRMRRVLGRFIRGDGAWHAFGDTSPVGHPRSAAVIRLAHDLLGPAADDAPEWRAWHLKEAGFCGARLEDIEVVLDCGPFGAGHQPGHGHCDGLSFVLSLGRTAVIIDSGIAGYADDPHRHGARATAAHNTVQVDGLEQTEIWNAFRAARRSCVGPARVTESVQEIRLFGTVSPYHARSVVHEREVIVRRCDDAPEITVRDRVRGARGRRLDTRLHFAPGTRVRDEGPAAWRLRCGGRMFEIKVVGMGGVRWTTAPTFPDWGRVEEAPVLHGWISACADDEVTCGFRLRVREGAAGA